MQSVEINPPTWYVRPYRPGDEKQLAALYAEVTGRERPVEVWRWKLMEREISPAAIWVAATHDERRIVGQYAGIPLTVKLSGVERTGLNTVEAMTAPDFRRQGIITRLGETAHREWAQAGYAAALALPNEQWGSRTYALGFRRIQPLAWLRFPLHVERVIARTRRLPGPLAQPAAIVARTGSSFWRSTFERTMRRRIDGSNVNVQVATGQDDFDHIWSEVGHEIVNGVVRDGEWVDWRFVRAAQHPYTVLVARKEGEPKGYIAYRTSGTGERTNGYIADIFLGRGEEATANALVNATLEDLSAKGAAIVMATAIPGSELYGALRRRGFLPAGRSTAFNFEIAPLQPYVDPAALADPRTWHLTAGDFDVV